MNKAMGMLAGAALLVIGAGTASAATFTSDHDVMRSTAAVCDLTGTQGDGTLSSHHHSTEWQLWLGEWVDPFSFNTRLQDQAIRSDVGNAKFSSLCQ